MTQLLGVFSGWQAPISNSWSFGKQIASTVVQKSWNIFSQIYEAIPCTRKKQPSAETEFQRIEIVIDRTPVALHQEIRSAVSANILELERIKKICIYGDRGLNREHARMCIIELERCRAFIFNTDSTLQETVSEARAIRDRMRVLLHTLQNSHNFNTADLQPLNELLEHLNGLMLQANLY